MRKRTWKRQDKLIKIAIIMFAVCIFMTTGYGLFHDEVKINGTATARATDPNHDPEEILSGSEFKEKLISLVGTMGYQNIAGFLHSNRPPSYQIQNDPSHDISGPDSTYPCYVWLNNNNIYWWSPGTPKMPQDASSMFEGFSNLTSIQGLSYFDWSTCKNMENMFSGCMNLNNLQPLQNINVSNVTNMKGLFNGCQNLRFINYLSNWNVSNVTDMSYMFYNNKIQNLNSLSNWNVGNVLDYTRMFYECSTINDATGINNWNINGNAIFYQMFYGVSNTPTFSNVTGSFDGEGTFIPSRSRSVIQENVIDEEITNTIDDSNIIESSNIVEENKVESENIETNNTIEQIIVNEIEESEKNFEEKNNSIEDLTNVEDKVYELNEKGEKADDKSTSESN